MKKYRLTHQFVETIPDTIQEGVLYVSMEYGTAVHRCCCGCGSEVVTPLSPTDWTLIFNGQSISLDPSIGNWSFPCQSHYWITNSRIEWATQWSKTRIREGRLADLAAKHRHDQISRNTQVNDKPSVLESPSGFWNRIKQFFLRF